MEGHDLFKPVRDGLAELSKLRGHGLL
jgi:hypothetical protein